jgi:hypothetical protein
VCVCVNTRIERDDSECCGENLIKHSAMIQEREKMWLGFSAPGARKRMPRGIYWFRKALRVDDNPSLLHAAARCSQLLPIFIIDPVFVNDVQSSQAPGSGVGKVG